MNPKTKLFEKCSVESWLAKYKFFWFLFEIEALKQRSTKLFFTNIIKGIISTKKVKVD